MPQSRLGKLLDEVCSQFPGAVWGACRLDFSQYKGKEIFDKYVELPYILSLWRTDGRPACFCLYKLRGGWNT